MTGVVCWITGLPSAGKSTFAERAADAFRGASVPVCVLDGDAVRHALGDVFGYGDVGRAAFYRALADLAAMLAKQGLVVLVPATAHRRTFRDHARAAAPSFLEVHVDVDRDECARRDAKGLYAAEKAGHVATLPGSAAVPFEAPANADVVAHGGHDADAVAALVTAATPLRGST